MSNVINNLLNGLTTISLLSTLKDLAPYIALIVPAFLGLFLLAKITYEILFGYRGPM